MILLPNNCHCSGTAADEKKGTSDQLTVFPSNWKTVKASLKKDWYVSYRFYDPTFKATHPDGKFVVIKGMNKLTTLKDRQFFTEKVMASTLNALIVNGYNPITKHSIAPTVQQEADISPLTPWIRALEKAYLTMSLSPEMATNLKSVVKYMDQAAKQLRIDQLFIKDVKKRHVKLCLDLLQKTRPLEKVKEGNRPKTWGATSYNRYRAYLMKMFDVLVDMEAIETCPATKIEKQVEEAAERETLTDEEMVRVDTYLKTNYYTFWRYMRIFFHSGGRTTELLKLQAKDVDLENQKIVLTSYKGRKMRRVEHTITNNALPLWQEIMETAKAEDYVFSEGLQAGSNSLNVSQIKRRWTNHVKAKLNITADFYSLKHSNLDKVSELLGDEDAAKAAGHTTTAMVKKVYAIKQQKIKAEKAHERIKKADIPFVKA